VEGSTDRTHPATYTFDLTQTHSNESHLQKEKEFKVTKTKTRAESGHRVRRTRRIAMLMAISMLASLLGASVASAAPTEITDATFEWSISEEVQSAPPFGGCNYLSAGASDGTEAGFLTTSGDVTVVKNGA